VDGAAIMNQTALARGSYGPYCRAMVRICKEESFHNRQGYEIMMSLAQGSPEQKELAQDALNRWWWPSIMMLGPSDDQSPNSDQLMRWKVKMESNDDIRQRFIDRTVPQADFIGLTIPDKDMKFNETTGHYEHGPINWNEFFDVIKGNGPCNTQRLKDRVDADKNGKWVRDAALAYAKKTSLR
jgi:ring-1,2-phenylacetyl-CoA epoxidase subunit PaaA